MNTTVFSCHQSAFVVETTLCSRSISFFVRGGGGAQTNAFQSVTDFSFSPAVDEDRGERKGEKERGEGRGEGWEPRGEIPRASSSCTSLVYGSMTSRGF